MQNIIDLFNNPVLYTVIISWFLAQILKFIIEVFFTKRPFSLGRFIFGSGGMPSSHSSFSTSMALAVGFREGFHSSIFIVALGFALIVMYDAAGVRRETGKQARILNRLMEHSKKGEFTMAEKSLKELVGHTPFEVLGGFALGIAVAVVFEMLGYYG